MIPRILRLTSVISVFITICGWLYQTHAQSGVDPTYIGTPTLSIQPTSGNGTTSIRQAAQTDGKVLVWGNAIAVSGVAKGRIARLNVDGSLDTGFTYCHCGVEYMNNLLPLPDGKLLVAGGTVNGWKVVRLNGDGSLDGTFNFAPLASASNTTATLASLGAGGKFYVIRAYSFQGFNGTDLYRFNEDGTQDTGFSGVALGSGSPSFSQMGAIESLADGSVYVAINTNAPFQTLTSLKRYTNTGASDPTWETPLFGGTFQSISTITGLDTQADGSLLVSGNFDVVNGVQKVDLVRLMPAGNVDLGFTGPTSSQGTGVRVLSSGKILVSMTSSLGAGNRLYRLNTDGSLDGTYTMDAAIANIDNPWILDMNERPIFAYGPSLVRLLIDGSRDTSFNPNIGIYGRVHTLARQPDGKFLVAGEFTGFNGVLAAGIVRTHADGTLDPTFDPGTGFNSVPTKIVVQPDGKMLVIGLFTTYNGNPVARILRLMPNGSVDPQFSVILNAGSAVRDIWLMSDGRIYLSGTFSTVNGTARNGVARVHTDGTLDQGFNALIGGSADITAVVEQPDSKVLIGGSFTGVGGFNRSGFVRLDAGGTLDQTFNPTNITAGRIYLGANGKVYTHTDNTADTVTVLRRNPDGTTDASFASPAFQHTFSSGTTRLDALREMPDGTILVAGFYNRVGQASRVGIVRLSQNGSVDPLFLPAGADDRVRAMIDAGSGKLLIGGHFTRIEATTKAGLARLELAPFRKIAPFDFDGDGRTDFAAFRPSTNVWYILRTSDWAVVQTTFGIAGDIVAPADFDGDGKTDLGIFRPASGDWWYAASTQGGAHRTAHHGVNGDIPRPSDFDGDGKADMIVYRPSNGTWYRLFSNGNVSSLPFGAAGDQPVIGDFDGDGKSDAAIFRPSTGDWWYAASSAGNAHRAVHWGQAGDLPSPGDYDGDGKTDYAVFRPSEGGWYVGYNSGAGVITTTFGLNGDRPIPGDFDGDGSVDIAVFRPSNGQWYLLQTTSGFGAVQWGLASDVVIPNAFVP